MMFSGSCRELLTPGIQSMHVHARRYFIMFIKEAGNKRKGCRLRHACETGSRGRGSTTEVMSTSVVETQEEESGRVALLILKKNYKSPSSSSRRILDVASRTQVSEGKVSEVVLGVPSLSQHSLPTLSPRGRLWAGCGLRS